jgi:lipoic acid synthetase
MADLVPKPPWLKVRAPGGSNYIGLKRLLRSHNLHTVCEEARCPNIGECFENLTATFLILGDVCTRNCGYCAIRHGRPTGPDRAEPDNVAHAIRALGLKHVVITSVDRDDLGDGGSTIFAATIRRIREVSRGCSIEVLIPDFQGSREALENILEAKPDILNHNTETVPRLYRVARPGGKYLRTLELLGRAAKAGVVTKSGLMLGLGETETELLETLQDLRNVDCQILTLGQYLPPSRNHIPVARYYSPDEFTKLKHVGESFGFRHVESGPLVRSSYHAWSQAQELLSERPSSSQMEEPPRKSA